MSHASTLPALLKYTGGSAQVELTDEFTHAPTVPAAVLKRHNARVLNPTTAVLAPGQPPPRPTVYSSDTLLLPRSFLIEGKTATINTALAGAGLVLKPAGVSEPGDPGLPGVPGVPGGEATDLVPYTLQVASASGGAEPPKPAVIDAWTALQHLRAVGTVDDATQDVVEPIRLEHLLFGTPLPPITGTPGSTDPSGGRGSSLGSYSRSATGGPIPVQMLAMAPPPRGEAGTGALPRRPVVAVLDTGTRQHPWLERASDPFLTVDAALQYEIKLASAARPGATPQRLIRDVEDTPTSSRPLIGTVDTHLGHGTFIAGIIRQIAPRARVLAIRVMHSDGVVYEGDLLAALRGLADRVQAAQAPGGDPNAMVDVVSLSLGYYDEYGLPSPRTGDLTEVIDRLTAMGVLVVAAAGNNATSREFLPAALAARTDEPERTRVVSVGARNPNGTHALFSNEAPWVRYWAPGAAIVSTYPLDVRGPVQPEIKPDGAREALDPDDFSCGFAVWDGTSFATPVAAAVLANGLIEWGAQHSEHAMDRISQAATLSRARATLDEVSGNAYPQHLPT